MRTKLTIVIACAALLLASCSDNEKSPLEKGDTKSAFLSIKAAGNSRSASRSDEPSATGTTATLYNALIYFVDGATDPLIYDVLTAGGAGADLTLAELEEGVVIEDVSTQVTQVYIIGNYNSADEFGRFPTFPQTPGQRLSAVRNVVLDIQQVSYPQIGATPVGDELITVMDGQATLQEYTAGDIGWTGDNTPEVGDMYANVVISPIVARIEIVDIAYTGVLNYTLEGIYLNNGYVKVPLSLDLMGRAPINNGSDPENYDPDNALTYLNYSTLYDLPGLPATGNTVFTPTNGTWAYQAFGDSSPAPHIILKLTDVTAADGTEVADQYLTVTGFRYGNDEVMTLQRNTIYKITRLAFTDEDLTLLPEPEEIQVWVHVEVQPWITLNVTPII